jgi:hypothetical protein
MVTIMARTIMRLPLALGLAMALAPLPSRAEAPPKAAAAFDSYIAGVEARLAQDHRAPTSFLEGAAATPDGQARLRRGEVLIEQVKTPEIPGAMLHDWRGTAFIPGATAAAFEKLLRNFDAYAQVFAPQVISSRTLAAEADHIRGIMRVRQKYVITVVLDTTYDVRFGRLDPDNGWSASRSTQVREIADAGTPHEHALPPEDDHGFLWRINTCWTWQERDGGLYIQVESISLTRGIPTGLGWIVGPFVQSVPRESLAFTLNAAGKAITH